MNCFEDEEKRELDLQSNNTGEVEEEMSVCSVPTASGLNTNWQKIKQKYDMKQFSILTALSHSFEVEAHRSHLLYCWGNSSMVEGRFSKCEC